MRELELKRSPKVASLILLGGIVVMALGFSLGSLRNQVLGGVLAFLGAVFLLDRRTKVAVSPLGVRYASWGAGTVPWAEFASFRLVSRRGYVFVQLVPRHPDLLRTRFSAFGRFHDASQRLLRQPRFSIPISILVGPVGEAMRMIRGLLPETPAA